LLLAHATQYLSGRWRRVWALLPKLCFRDVPEPHCFRDALVAHEVPLRDLQVGAGDATPESLAVWLPAAARRISGNLTLLNPDPAKGAWEEEGEASHRGAFELPCFEKATSISLFLVSPGLAMPPTGVFARLTEISLDGVRFHGPCTLGDAVSSPQCPCLQTVAELQGMQVCTGIPCNF
jgi:hypothetical protein